MATSTSKTIAGLVLSGGGALGAYEVGVIKALCEGSPATNKAPLDATVFAGTSVGSFNAAVLAMNIDGPAASAKRLTDLWLNTIADQGDGRGNRVYRIRGDVTNYVDFRIPGSPLEQFARVLSDVGALRHLTGRTLSGFLSTHGSLLSRVANQVDLSIFLNTEPFAQLVKDTIKPAVLRASLDDSGDKPAKKLSVTATSWGSGKARTFDFPNLDDEQVWAAIHASAAIPCLFPAVKMVGEFYIDGGVLQNTPLTDAVDEGATEVHVVSLTPADPNRSEEYSGTTLDILSRILLSVVEANIRQDLEWVKEINRGIEAIRRIAGGREFDASDARPIAIAVGRMENQLSADEFPRLVTVHRYFPQKTLGGLVDMLNFDRAEIEKLIQRGYDDAISHKCGQNCVVPEAAAA
jgi:NTE family protein